MFILLRKKFILFLSIFVLILTSTACANSVNNAAIKNTSEEVKFGITRQQFNLDFSLPNNETVIQIADGLMENKLTAQHTIEAMEYDIDKLDWNVKFSESSATFQLYLQCLNPIVYLIKTYELGGGRFDNKEYLEQAEKFIYSWYEYMSDEKKTKNNSMVWYDHGTALRAENLIYFALVSEEAGYLKEDTKKLIWELLKIHGDFLANSNNYTSNHNHGIFQDRALLYIAYFLDNDKSEDWIAVAEKRLRGQMDFAFTEEMVHVENSPAYHIGILPMFKNIADFLLQFDDAFGKELYEKAKESIHFLTYMTKPNGALAAIGDSSDELADDKKKVVYSEQRALDFDDEEYLYAMTQGEKGVKPDETSVFYPKSGYYISHNSWDNENYPNSTWMMFKSGYSAKTHKHADDNSFMLYSKGKDIFVDTGWYNYNFGNWYRDYFVSARAHNSVVVDGKSYSPTAENSSNVGIFDYGKKEGYDYAAGFNDMYYGVQMDRYFYNLGDAVLLYDNIKSEDKHVYSQLFHASEDMKILEQSDNEVLFELMDTGYYVRVRQLLNNTNLEMIKGDFDKAEYGYLSKKINDLRSIDTAKFNAEGTNVDFVTLITIENQDGKIENINNIDFDLQNYTLKVDSDQEYEINLKERERIHLNDISIEQQGNKLTLTNHCVGDGFVYAWYIIDANKNTAVDKFGFQDSNTLEYELKEKEKYIVRAYIQNNTGQKKYAIAAVIEYDKKTREWKNKTEEYPYLNLIYDGQKYNEIGKNKYRFEVDYRYSFDTKIVWYVYRNGSYFDTLTSYNENTLEYTFREKGDYSISYYLTTAEGNNEQWNFPVVKIE